MHAEGNVNSEDPDQTKTSSGSPLFAQTNLSKKLRKFMVLRLCFSNVLQITDIGIGHVAKNCKYILRINLHSCQVSIFHGILLMFI